MGSELFLGCEVFGAQRADVELSSDFGKAKKCAVHCKHANVELQVSLAVGSFVESDCQIKVLVFQSFFEQLSRALGIKDPRQAFFPARIRVACTRVHSDVFSDSIEELASLSIQVIVLQNAKIGQLLASFWVLKGLASYR